MKCGLLGRHLQHSYSPQIHSSFAQYDYALYETEPEDLENFLKTMKLTGLNVTIPYKRDVLPYMDALSPEAKRLGAVNTILRRTDGSLIGHNTDYFGFASMLQRTGLQVYGKKALVLGSGGASATAVAVLDELGCNTVVISRSGKNHYGNLALHQDAVLIVNATPVGMYPNVGNRPIDLDLFPRLEGVLDLIYNPARTQLLMDAERRGLIAQNGLWMLVAQAKESAERFIGRSISDNQIPLVYTQLRSQMENIVFIGMPGCGKSSVASLIAKKLNRPMVDTDQEIEKEAGCSIPEFFSLHGEDAFRALETSVIKRLGKESGLILATGGGCVTRQENYPLLHQNARIFWLTRALDKLSTEGRPISKVNRLEDLYAQRKPLYSQFADHVIHNDGTLEETAASIIALLGSE